MSLPERAYGKIKVVSSGGVTTITLAYPERRNAIGPQMTNELLWAHGDASAWPIQGLFKHYRPLVEKRIMDYRKNAVREYEAA